MQQNFTQLIIPLILIPILLFFYWRLRLKKLAFYKSPLLGKIEILQKYNGEKVLTINSYPQGVSIKDKSIEKSYWFAIAKEVVQFCKNKTNPQVLMLGLGANAIPNLIAGQDHQINQTIIEIDKYIIQACRKYFNLDNLPNYQIIQADAYKFFNDKKTFDKKFDAVIVDIFIGRPPYVSLESNQPNFIEKLLPWIKPEGMIIFNRPAHTPESRSDSQKLKEYLSTLFKQTRIIFVEDPRGYKTDEIVGLQKKVT